MVENVSKQLVKLGHSVEVVTLDPSGKLPLREEIHGVPVRRFYGLAPANSYFMPHPKVYNYLRSVQADLFHVHNIAALLAPTCWLAIKEKRHQAGLVISPHHHAEGSLWHTRLLWKPYRPIASWMARSADVVHCVSEYEADLVREHFGIHPVVVPNGVSEDVFKYRWLPPKEGFVLTYAGRVERFKRVDMLIETASALVSKGLQVKVRIIGDGADLERLMALASRVEVAVEHSHFLDREEYISELSKSSCFVNLSKYEAYSIVAAEAIAIGLPVVLANPWGSIFKGYSKNFLVDCTSVEDVANAILYALSAEVAGTGPAFSWAEVAKKMVDYVYEPALHAKVGIFNEYYFSK